MREALTEPLRAVAGRREWIVSLGTKDSARAAEAVARIKAHHAAALAMQQAGASTLPPRKVALNNSAPGSLPLANAIPLA